MKTLDFKPVKRCGKCNHLIPKTLTECPYCKGRVFLDRVQTGNTIEPLKLSKPKIKLTAKQKKIALSIAAAAVLIWGVVFFAQFVIDSRALGKTIMEPLSERVLKKRVKKDNSFSTFYSQVEEIREELLSLGEQDNYKSITYNQLKGFLMYCTDNSYCEKVAKEARDRYTVDVLNPLQPKINELKERWEKFIEDHDVNRYLVVEAVEAGYRNFSSWGISQYNPIFYFKITEPEGEISDGIVSIEVLDSDENVKYKLTRTNLTDLKQNSSVETPMRVVSTDSHFWDEYNVRAVVHSITLKDGTIITDEDIQEVPKAVRAYIDQENEDTLLQMIVDQIDHEFEGPNEYAYKAVIKDLQEKDPICFELVQKCNSQLIPKSSMLIR